MYDGPVRPVYELATVDSEKPNKFRLVVVLYFIDDSKSQEFVSPVFLLRNKPGYKKRKLGEWNCPATTITTTTTTIIIIITTFCMFKSINW